MDTRRSIDEESLLRLAAVAVHENAMREYEKPAGDSGESILQEADVLAGWEKVMKRYRRRERVNWLKAFPRELLRKLLALLTAVSMLGSGVAATVMATNPSIREMVLTDFGEYSNLQLIFSGNRRTNFQECPSDWEGMYYPAYIPQGYEFAKMGASPSKRALFYSNDSGAVLQFALLFSTIDISLNTEGMNVKDITVEGHDAVLYCVDDNSRYMLLMNYDDCAILISGFVSSTEIIKIASNIQENTNNNV